jgi:hypothetical protein
MARKELRQDGTDDDGDGSSSDSEDSEEPPGIFGRLREVRAYRLGGS